VVLTQVVSARSTSLIQSATRDVVLTKRCGNARKKLAILKQLQTHFKAKLEKSVGTPFSPHYAPVCNGPMRPLDASTFNNIDFKQQLKGQANTFVM